MAETSSAFEKAVAETLEIDVRASLICSHPRVETLLDYETGALPAHERSLVEAHAVRCGICRSRLQLLEGEATRTQRELREHVPGWSFASWHLQHAHPEASSMKRPVWQPARAVVAFGAAAAAVACIAAGIAQTLRPSSGLIARGGEWSAVRWDLVALFSGAGVAIAILVLVLMFGRRR